MGETANPLRVEYAGDLEGLTVVRQAAPSGAASCSLTYVGPAGWGYESAEQAGIARLVNQLATAAAGPYDRIALARRLDRVGATVSFQTAPESAEVTLWGPADEWEALLRVLAEMVLRPRFDPEDIERVRRQAFERSLRETTQPASRADKELLRAIFPEGHPYRSTGIGEATSLRRVRRADLERFHRDHYSSGGALLVVTGPARASAVVAAARGHFEEFGARDAPKLRVPVVRPPGPRVERSIDLPGRAQVELRMGGSSIARGAPEYPAAYLANEVLGGRPLLSRLFQRVRERGGLAYHASSALEAMRFGGFWAAHAGTGADRWRRVVPMVRSEIARIASQTVPPAELNRIRESAIGQLPLLLESTSEAHELAVDLAYHGLPSDYWITWPATLRAISGRAVREAAATAIDPAGTVTVLAGPLRRRP